MESSEKLPETIQSAALRVGNDVFTGRDHTDTIIAAEEELGPDWMEKYSSDFEDGFMTSQGRFVDRGEAAGIARKNNQTNRPYQDGDALDSNHLK